MNPAELLLERRPKEHRVQIIAPDGGITFDKTFGTRQEAIEFPQTHRG